MELHDVWFVLIAVLWIGYFFLEGFDFGVGVLTKLLARDRPEKRVLINTIGPVWDGNEVWLLSAGGATFAAFPEWYATLFSGFYLPLLLILVCLIVRGVAFEYRVKRPEENWQRNWETRDLLDLAAPRVPVGRGLRQHRARREDRPDFEYVGTLGDLLNPYALLGGLVTLTLFTFHGTVFVGLKTVGDIRERARKLALRVGPGDGRAGAGLPALDPDRQAVTASRLVAAGRGRRRPRRRRWRRTQAGREGWAFALSGVTIVAAVAMLFLTLFPNVMPSSLNADWSLTVTNASSSPYTLKIMTWCAAIATPVVMLYQGWTYWVFRKRIGTQHIAESAH